MTTAHWRAMKTAGCLCYNQQIALPLFSELGANALGIRYGFVVGEVRHAGYDFSLREILLTVELLLNEIDT